MLEAMRYEAVVCLGRRDVSRMGSTHPRLSLLYYCPRMPPLVLMHPSDWIGTRSQPRSCPCVWGAVNLIKPAMTALSLLLLSLAGH